MVYTYTTTKYVFNMKEVRRGGDGVEFVGRCF